jgi:hypothetical protein
LRGIFFGNAEVEKDPSAEFAQGIDVVSLSLDGGHVGPFFARFFAQTRHFRRICDINFSLAQNHRPDDSWRQAQSSAQKLREHRRAGGDARAEEKLAASGTAA